MIDIENVNKRFGSQVVLSDITVHFKRGEISGLIGRNGSGKSVLLKCIVGLMQPDCGQITVNGLRIGKDVDFAQDTGFIIDRPGFLNDRSGYENLKYLALIRGKVSNHDIRSSIEQVGLNPEDHKHVGKYSQGMRQRLGIAQALMENPSIIILDEPMNALDNKAVEEIRELLLSLKLMGKTLIITSHDMKDIDALCDCVYEMDAGRLIQVR